MAKTKEERIATNLKRLVEFMAADMLFGTNSGIEDLYTDYVATITKEDGSY